MTIRRNQITPGWIRPTPQVPIIGQANYDTKLEIYFDTKTGQAELKMPQGKLTPTKIARLLSENVTALLKQFEDYEAKQLASNPTPPADGSANGGTPNGE